MLEGFSSRIDYKTLVRAALMHGTWYYTGSTCSENSKRITYNPTNPSENRPTLDGQFNTLSLSWYCVVSLEDEEGLGLTLKNLGFEYFYEKSGILSFKLDHPALTNK